MKTEDDTVEDDTPTKPFAAWLQDHRNGRVHAELTSGLMALTEQVKATGKAGSISLTINLRPEGRMVIATDRVTLKLPEDAREPAMYFADGSYNLVREDPEQQRLPLREVPPSELKEAK